MATRPTTTTTNDEDAITKQAIFQELLPHYLNQLQTYETQIKDAHLEIDRLRMEQNKMMKKFQSKCIHKYGDEYREIRYGHETGDRYKNCVYCGLSICTHEMAF
jgi:hypothetical protein